MLGERRARRQRAAEELLGARIGQRDAAVGIDGDDTARDVAQTPSSCAAALPRARVRLALRSAAMRRNAVNTGLNSTVGSASSGGTRDPLAIDSAAWRSVPIGRASSRAASPLNQNAASAPTALANATSTPRSRRRRSSVSSLARAGVPMTTAGSASSANERNPNSIALRPTGSTRVSVASPRTASVSSACAIEKAAGRRDVLVQRIARFAQLVRRNTGRAARRDGRDSAGSQAGAGGGVPSARSVSRTSNERDCDRVGRELAVRPDRERGRGNDEEREQRQRESRAIAAAPRASSCAQPATTAAVRDDAGQPKELRRSARSSSTSSAPRWTSASSGRSSTSTCACAAPVPVRTIQSPCSRVPSRRHSAGPLAAAIGSKLAKSNGVRRLDLRAQIEAEQPRERIGLEQPALRRHDRRGDAAIGRRSRHDELDGRVGRHRLEDRDSRAPRVGDDARDVVERQRHLRRLKARRRLRVGRPREQRDRIAGGRDVRQHVALQQRLARLRREVAGETRAESLQQRDGDGVDLTESGEIARRRVDAAARCAAPHERRRRRAPRRPTR